MGKTISRIALDEQVNELSKTTTFDKRELQQWLKGFTADAKAVTQTGEPAIDFSQFVAIYRKFFPFGNPTRYARHIFRVMDSDHDGLLGFAEFMRALSTFRLPAMQVHQVSDRPIGLTDSDDAAADDQSVDKKLKWAFTMYDINGDGVVDRDEMLEILDCLYEMLGTLAPPADMQTSTGNMGAAGQNETSAAALKRTQLIFDKMDTAGLNKLTLKDFQQVAKEDVILLEALSLYDGLV